MFFMRPTDSTILTQHGSPLSIVQVQLWCRVLMQVEHISHGVMISTTSRVYQSSWIVLLCPFGDLFGLKLPPCFVKGHPNTHRGIRIEIIDQLFPLVAEIGFRFSRAYPLYPVEVFSHLPFRSPITIGHVLPNNNTVAVAMGIPTSGFYLHVLTNHVKAQVFGFNHVILQRFIGRSGV